MGSVRARKETGQLFMDFRIDGARCREQTSLPDNAVNRRKLEKLLAQVELEIKLGKFNYASHFPNSKLAQRFATSESSGVTVTATAVPVTQVAVPMATPTAGDRSPFFRDFIEEWIAENQIGWRRSHITNIQGMVKKHYSSFLSCLCGSELLPPPRFLHWRFLSCLCGSELQGIAGKPYIAQGLPAILGQKTIFSNPSSCCCFLKNFLICQKKG
jgi:hypothetical protein